MSNKGTMLNRLQATASSAKARGFETLDARLPPQRRQELYDRLQSWARQNPKLAAFIAAHAICSVPPILLFLTYVTTLLLASTFAALSVALVFVGISAALACLVLVPVLFVTSVSATGFFIAGYIALRLAHRFRQGSQSTSQVAKSSGPVEQEEKKVNGEQYEKPSTSAVNGEQDSILARGQSVQSHTSSSGMATPASRSTTYTVPPASHYSVLNPPASSTFSQDGDAVAIKQEAVERAGLAEQSQACGPAAVKATAPPLHSRPALF